MSKLFARWFPCATLATWSGILLYFYFSGRVSALLAPPFRPYVLVAGIVLALMAAVFLLTPADASCCSAADCGHSLARMPIGKLLTFGVLLLPITVSATFSPASFGRTAIENRGIDTDGSTLQPRKTAAFAPPEMPLPTKDDAPSSAQPPAVAAAPEAKNASDYLQRTPEGFIVVEVLDLLYAAQDGELRKDFENKKVELVGQLMPDKGVNGTGPKRFKAVRMFMTCCAADARPVATLVETDNLPDLPEMTWVKVVGTSTFPLENGRRTAVLKSERIEQATPPDESMLY
ncbi:MAG: hypothetical protein JWL59_4273 [Chthoniobacteraceae bacterium]|nr:hypothetical protein [Chthoniobacteraceae bacterium]